MPWHAGASGLTGSTGLSGLHRCHRLDGEHRSQRHHGCQRLDGRDWPHRRQRADRRHRYVLGLTMKDARNAHHHSELHCCLGMS